MTYTRRTALMLMAATVLSGPALAQLPPPTDDAKDSFPAQKHFSPYVGRNFPTQLLWGDTHVHTGMYISSCGF